VSRCSGVDSQVVSAVCSFIEGNTSAHVATRIKGLSGELTVPTTNTFPTVTEVFPRKARASLVHVARQWSSVIVSKFANYSVKSIDVGATGTQCPVPTGVKASVPVFTWT
jgi:hypothetical protein